MSRIDRRCFLCALREVGISIAKFRALQVVHGVLGALDDVPGLLQHVLPRLVEAVVAQLHRGQRRQVQRRHRGRGRGRGPSAGTLLGPRGGRRGNIGGRLSASCTCSRGGCVGGRRRERRGRRPLKRQVHLVGEVLELPHGVLHAVEAPAQLRVPEVELLQGLLQALHRLEAETDRVQVQGLAAVHSIPLQLPHRVQNPQQVPLVIPVVNADAARFRNLGRQHPPLEEGHEAEATEVALDEPGHLVAFAQLQAPPGVQPERLSHDLPDRS
mmetsp:Transcript_18494/g.51441  ORF Transcript_18494/g.51441 Transcript_18494/m.51441 type:complete len:270 (+) Transcript_18494:540-1349(+)